MVHCVYKCKVTSVYMVPIHVKKANFRTFQYYKYQKIITTIYGFL